MPKFTNIAISVDIPSMRTIANGPASLPIRSIRRICELRTIVMDKLFVLIPEMITIEGPGRLLSTYFGGPIHYLEPQQQPERVIRYIHVQCKNGLNLPSLSQRIPDS